MLTDPPPHQVTARVPASRATASSWTRRRECDALAQRDGQADAAFQVVRAGEGLAALGDVVAEVRAECGPWREAHEVAPERNLGVDARLEIARALFDVAAVAEVRPELEDVLECGGE